MGRRIETTCIETTAIDYHTDTLKFLKGMTTSMSSSLNVWTEAFMGQYANIVALQQSKVLFDVISRFQILEGTHPSFRTRLALSSAVCANTFEWARFLVQKKVTIYYDETEQVGVRLGNAETHVDCGEEIWPLCGALEDIDASIVHRQLQTTDRWSYYGSRPTKYMSGPISMINHACRAHFNVSFQKMPVPNWHNLEGTGPDYIVAVAERRIEAADRIYAVYDDNEDSLFESRDICCTVCAKIKFV